MSKDTRFIRFLVHNGVILSVATMVLVIGSFVVDKLTIYDESTQIATLVFANREYELHHTLYSAIQVFAALPLATIIIITITILGQYIKLSVDQARSKRSLDKFMLAMSHKAHLDSLYKQHQIANDLFLDDSKKKMFKIEYNNLITEFNAFSLETIDATELTVEEQIAIKNEALAKYNELKRFFEQVGDNLKLQEVIKTITKITTELNSLLAKKV